MNFSKKQLFKIIEEDGGLAIYKQSAGQYSPANRKLFYGWRMKLVNILINKILPK